MILLLKLLALASFVGGPLILMDWLAPQPGEPITFVLMFVPLALMLFGGLSLDDGPDARRSLSARAGIVGAALLLLQNAVATWLMVRGATEPVTFGLNLGGVIVGDAVAVWYLYLNLRTPPPFDLAREIEQAELRARLRDYALLAISLCFVATGVLLLSAGKRDVGITTIAFFGACGIVPVLSMRRKRRDAHARALGTLAALTLPVDRTLWPSRRRVLLGGLVALALGLIMLHFGTDYPLLGRIISALIAALGALIAGLCLLGKLPVGYLRFEPTGLALGRRGYELFVPWSAISAVSIGEYYDNPAVLIDLYQHDAVQARPPERADRVRAELQRNQNWVGVPLSILCTQYAVDAPNLALTLELERARSADPLDSGA